MYAMPHLSYIISRGKLGKFDIDFKRILRMVWGNGFKAIP